MNKLTQYLKDGIDGCHKLIEIDNELYNKNVITKEECLKRCRETANIIIRLWEIYDK